MEDASPEQRPLGARDFFETYLFTYIARNISVDYPVILTRNSDIRQNFVEISREKLLSRHQELESLSDLETLMMLTVYWDLIVDFLPEIERDFRWNSLLEPKEMDSRLLDNYMMSSQTLSNALKRGGLSTAWGNHLLKLAAEDAYRFFRGRSISRLPMDIHYQYYIYNSLFEAIDLYYKENTCHLTTSSGLVIKIPFRSG